MIDMHQAAARNITLGIVAALACGALMAEEPDVVLGGNLNGSQTARRVTLGSNLFVEPL